MRVLIAYATAHGSTRGIAGRIAGRLREMGIEVDVSAFGEAADPSTYDAIILGSAIHSSAWLPPAVDYVRRHQAALTEKRPWMFSTGSIGEENAFFPELTARLLRRGGLESKAMREIREAINAREHHYFAGAVKRSSWPWYGALFLWAFGGRHGDHRNWPAIDAWANRIIDEMNGVQ